ncbi:hypothetical protein [Psychrobacter sp. SHUES1]|uniref:hypothetical protein n=1 Tax=Psychrobacter sp. SHUES1 TaxID=1849383 RepID=UPI0007F4DEF9|nr:hypothetical protein [Psychrobacter sp. SHUES1]OAP71944.1 hypothetical protein A7325_09860 [Psychrobacter sp. SHUES1]
MNNIIISLTTTSNRLHLCRAALYSLVTQSLRPHKIVLNLSSHPYLKDEGIQNTDVFFYLTQGIEDELKKIIHIEWVENTGPFRKLMPTLQAAGLDDIIVTADDDIIYGQQWLSSLLQDFDPERMLIHASRVRKIQYSKLGHETGYIYWPIVQKKTIIDKDWIITYGGGAVLYRGWFTRDLVDDNGYLSVAPTADDLWYSKICKVSGLQVRVIPEALKSLNFIKHNNGLENENLPRVKNNKLISRVKHRFIDHPLNYYRVTRFGNDFAYDSIEKYFES